MARTDTPFSQCTRHLNGHGPRLPAIALREALNELAEEEGADVYGSGPIIESFEARLADLLGKEAAVFMPSGTMAQLIALRIWCDAASCKQIAMHATSHLELHERGAYAELHAIEAQLLADRDRLMTLGDLQALQTPLAAILWELPQREIGGQLPAWRELGEQCQWARERGIRTHLDGARLWEAAPHYARSHAEIAALFDSIYVSFYKGIGGIAGAVLAGRADFIETARVWLRRHGGNLISMYPYVLSARAGLNKRLDAFATYRDRARELASLLAAIDGINVVPREPPTAMMHLHIDAAAEIVNRANNELAAQSQVMLFGRASERGATQSKVELTIGDAAADLSNAEIVELFRQLLAKSR